MNPSWWIRLFARVATGRLRPWTSALLLGMLLAAAEPARAGQPFVWDDDSDGIDDRLEQVHLLGYSFAFQNADTLSRQRFEVTRVAGDLVYGVYVLFKSAPTPSDVTALGLLGMPVLHRLEGVPALRSAATFAQAQAARALSSVERIEVVPLLYPETREAAASVGARDPGHEVFPDWTEAGGAAGDGVIVAILDTGINDAPDGGYPGHESLIGRRAGGAEFTHGDSALDTPPDGSIDPVDRGAGVTHDHGTHVAGLVLGSGGASGYAMGIAPAARFVDVKVLNDVGAGTGIAEALDWCIHNRNRDWGLGSAWRGIDVINLSLSSLDESDGNDVSAQLAALAAALGIVVVAAAGNDGLDHHVPSPAAANGVLAIGAYDCQRTPRADDDRFATFSNRGPRASNGSADTSDEQKPDLVAPGVSVLSADGDLMSDGTHYQRLSGTSMSAAVVSGAVALLRSEFPTLPPAQLADVLRATARRGLADVPAGGSGPDPRWQPAIGWGAIDVYAARLELTQPDHSQVRRLALTADTATVTATVWTQRERGAAYYVLERAADAGGTPGAFSPLDSLAAHGDSSLALNDITPYTIARFVPLAERGTPFWYRVSYTESGRRFDTAARPFTSPVGTSAATISVQIVHDAYDHDIDAAVTAGGTGGLLRESSAQLHFALPGSSASVASDWVDGTSATGTTQWTFRIEVPAGAASAFLPPSASSPWQLQVTDGGYANRGGRIVQYQIVYHGPQGDESFEGSPMPLPTVEGLMVQSTIPAGLTAVEPGPAGGGFRAAPSPVFAGGVVRLSASDRDPGEARVFDLSGRVVARVPFVAEAGRWVARWNTAAAAHAATPGVYFVRAGERSARIVVIAR